MKEYVHRQKIAKFILYSNFLLFALIFTIYLLNGFDNKQLEDILQILIPIKTLYITALVKYIIANKNLKHAEHDKEIILNPIYLTITNYLVYGYIFFIIIVIILRGIFSVFGFETMKYMLVTLETFFGAYIGLIISDMFKVK